MLPSLLRQLHEAVTGDSPARRLRILSLLSTGPRFRHQMTDTWRLDAMLVHMIDTGLIVATDEIIDLHGGRRRLYRLTRAGRDVLAAEDES